MSETTELSYLLYGPPGAGKTTVAEQIRQITNSEYFSFGGLVREQIQRGTQVVRHFTGYSTGPRTEFKPMEPEVVELVDEKVGALLVSGHGILFDGFPKHVGEVSAFQSIVKRRNLALGGIVLIEVPFDELLSRVELRRICADCLTQTTLADKHEVRRCTDCDGALVIRKEDHPERFESKYNLYTQVLEGTLEALSRYDIPMIRINGHASREQVAKRVDGAFQTLRRLEALS